MRPSSTFQREWDDALAQTVHALAAAFVPTWATPTRFLLFPVRWRLGRLVIRKRKRVF